MLLTVPLTVPVTLPVTLPSLSANHRYAASLRANQ
jgi:hypothetical protein